MFTDVGSEIDVRGETLVQVENAQPRKILPSDLVQQIFGSGDSRQVNNFVSVTGILPLAQGTVFLRVLERSWASSSEILEDGEVQSLFN